ncbi:MAG TPA: hypothetical protein DDZ90_26385 [Planctomycetaceae bacterium]|nr:hypothetical protein [Gimesia sp.]HBL46919.1 hypothetical protein [Planctomycetaceae bacterium]
MSLVPVQEIEPIHTLIASADLACCLLQKKDTNLTHTLIDSSRLLLYDRRSTSVSMTLILSAMNLICDAAQHERDS